MQRKEKAPYLIKLGTVSVLLRTPRWGKAWSPKCERFHFSSRENGSMPILLVGRHKMLANNVIFSLKECLAQYFSRNE